MLQAIHFFVFQKNTAALPSTHEMVVIRAGGKTAAYSGSWLLTVLTVLKKQTNKKTRENHSYFKVNGIIALNL